MQQRMLAHGRCAPGPRRVQRCAFRMVPALTMRSQLRETSWPPGIMGDSTFGVSALSRVTPLSDAEPLLRAMLSEHGIDVPIADD